MRLHRTTSLSPNTARAATRGAVLLIVGLAASAPARAAEWDADLGTTGGYTTTSSTVDATQSEASPYVSGWVSATAVFEPSERLAPFLALSYDAFVPLDANGVPGHGPLGTVGVVWLPSRRLAFDVSAWGLARFYGGEAPVTVGLVGGAVGGELTLFGDLGVQASGWHVRRFSDDPLLGGATTGLGPGLVWRPSRAVRLQATWGLEYGPAFLTDYGDGVLPVPTAGTPDDVWSQVVRAKLRVLVGGGFYVQPSYRLRLGEAADGGDYRLHSLQVAFGWRS